MTSTCHALGQITFRILLVVLALTTTPALAQKPAKPKLRVAADGFPSGRDTPEGVAADLERAFIKYDVALFTETCVGLYAGGGPAEYDRFMRKTIAKMEQEASRKAHVLEEPKAIAKVFAARHLSRNGPASYGYATFDFQDVMFVDVIVNLQNGQRSLKRTLVIQEKDTKWYAHPAPNVSPLLSYGLNEESASNVDFSEAYEIEK